MAAVHGAPSPGDAVREAICPYRGLDAFREEDAAFFFGRGSASEPDSPIGQLVGRVREQPFVMVVGRSGSGKSSLVCAGLLPALRRERDRFWNVLSLRPGPAPLRALAAVGRPVWEGCRDDDSIGSETKMPHAIIRGRNGRRHEVDFGDAPVRVEVYAGEETVEIFVEADFETHAEERLGFAILNIPRHLFSEATGEAARRATKEKR